MTVSTFIKENRVLIAGFTLPFLLIALLAISKMITTSSNPPQYSPVYITQDWSTKGKVIANADDEGAVTVKFDKSEATNPKGNLPKTTIIIYDPKTDTNREIQLKLEENEKTGEVTAKQPEELKSLYISNKPTSPDGYNFEPYHYRNGFLITNIFFDNHRRNTPSLTDGHHQVPMKSLPGYNPYNTTFIGWVIPENEKKQ